MSIDSIALYILVKYYLTFSKFCKSFNSVTRCKMNIKIMSMPICSAHLQFFSKNYVLFMAIFFRMSKYLLVNIRLYKFSNIFSEGRITFRRPRAGSHLEHFTSEICDLTSTLIVRSRWNLFESCSRVTCGGAVWYSIKLLWLQCVNL